MAERTDVPTDPEDVKILTLARAARVRTGAAQAACVRDTDGRTYAGTSVALASLRLSAIAVAVAMAVSSGAQGLEAVARCAQVDPAEVSEGDRAVVAELAARPVVIFCADGSGTLAATVEVG